MREIYHTREDNQISGINKEPCYLRDMARSIIFYIITIKKGDRRTMYERKTVHGKIIKDGRFDKFNRELDLHLLKEAIKVGYKAAENGDEPFGCLISDSDGNIIVEGLNSVIATGDPTRHGEVNAVHEAVKNYSPEFLWGCTIYVPGGPCAMCAGTIYWGNIGRIVTVTSIEKEKNRKLIENDNYKMLGIDFLEVLASGGKDIVIDGPYPELEDMLMKRFQWYTENYGKIGE